MVVRDGGNSGIQFKGYHRVTKGDPLYPTIFNMALDDVIRHWVTVVAPTKEGMEGLGLSIRDLVAHLYANNRFIDLTQPKRIQRAFSVLTGLFDWVGIRTNTQKTASMACWPCHTHGRM